jgi:hypothetical protein
LSKQDDASAAEELINVGSDIAGGVATTAAGLVVGGPTGALAGAASGPLVIRALRWAGREVRDRLLSHREEVRIGGALAFAAEEIRIRSERGEVPRMDGFFDEEVSPGRTPAEEILEGVLLSAERAYEEKKVPYIGKLYAGIAFDTTIDPKSANYLLTIANSLTWTQYLLLQVIAQNHTGALRLRETMFPPGGQEGLIQLAHEMHELSQRAFVSQKRPDQQQAEVILSPVQITPQFLRVQGIGSIFFRIASLQNIPPHDWIPIARLLGSRVHA